MRLHSLCLSEQFMVAKKVNAIRLGFENHKKMYFVAPENIRGKTDYPLSPIQLPDPDKATNKRGRRNYTK